MLRTTVLLVLALVLAPVPSLAAVATDAIDDDDVDNAHRSPVYVCGAQGKYAPNSSYEANLQHLAATLTAKVSLPSSSANSSYPYAGAFAGDRPDQVAASASCDRRRLVGANSSAGADCGSCVALAFRHARSHCAYQRHAMVDLRACRVNYYDVGRMVWDVGVISAVDANQSEWWKLVFVLDFPLVLAFQAAGFACVLFLFLQEWRANRRGPANLP